MFHLRELVVALSSLALALHELGVWVCGQLFNALLSNGVNGLMEVCYSAVSRKVYDSNKGDVCSEISFLRHQETAKGPIVVTEPRYWLVTRKYAFGHSL